MSRKYGITCIGFCIMPNHTHSAEYVDSEKGLQLFHQELNSMYSRIFNKYHGRSGPMFYRSFNYAPKTVGKKIRECLTYIANNPVVGNLSDDILDYRWNLIALYDLCPSKSGKISSTSIRLRKAISIVKDIHSCNQPLNYQTQKMLFKELSKDEQQLLIDYIVSLFNPVDVRLASMMYGGIENAITTMKANSGSEFDIHEDYEDYSSYKRIGAKLSIMGISQASCSFLSFTESEKERLLLLLLGIGEKRHQIENYLHLKHGHLDKR